MAAYELSRDDGRTWELIAEGWIGMGRYFVVSNAGPGAITLRFRIDGHECHPFGPDTQFLDVRPPVMPAEGSWRDRPPLL